MMERWLASLAPQWALRRQIARMQVERLYDAAALANNRRPPRGAGRSGDGVMEHARGKLTAWARHLDENHDLATGILDDLVAKIVGIGIAIEPMPMLGSQVSRRLSEQIRDALDEWGQAPEVTGELSMPELQRLGVRSWLRDGEVFAQHVEGNRYISRNDSIPYRLELIEADFCPFDLVDATTNTVHGVQKDTWGRPVAYHFYKTHPGDITVPGGSLRDAFQTKTVSADSVVHLKLASRIRQTRGTSVFHAVITRLDDIKDYEESERVKARVAAALTGYIKRSADFTNEAAITADGSSRAFEMAPGMIFDNLLPGEDIGVIDSNHPNSALIDFRRAQLRAVAAGTGSTYSSVAKSYDGTYSAQRQEMVESWAHYDRMRSQVVSDFLRPIYQRFVMALVTSGRLAVPAGVDMRGLLRAEYRGPATPWVDPKKEIEADLLAIEGNLLSRHQVIRKRGGDPQIVDQQIDQDTKHPTTPSENTAPAPPIQDDEVTDDEQAA